MSHFPQPKQYNQEVVMAPKFLNLRKPPNIKEANMHFIQTQQLYQILLALQFN